VSSPLPRRDPGLQPLWYMIKFLRARLDAHFPDRMLPYAVFWFNLRRF
jgi:hypothetical protein